MAKWLFVAGYGRSGSTLIDGKLGDHADIFSSGAIGHFPRVMAESEIRCSCRSEYDVCPVWPRVWETMENEHPGAHAGGREFSSFETWRAVPGLALSRRRRAKDAAEKGFAAFTTALTDAISDATGDPAYIVDSSKTVSRFVGRPLALRYLADQPVTILHNIRDGRGVVWSQIKKQQRELGRDLNAGERLMRIARSTLLWNLANLGAVLIGWLLPGRRLTITYEDLVRSDGAALDAVFRALELDPTRVDPTTTRHQLRGNRMRNQGPVQFREDLAWRDALSGPEKAVFWLLGWPGMILHRRMMGAQQPSSATV